MPVLYAVCTPDTYILRTQMKIIVLYDYAKIKLSYWREWTPETALTAATDMGLK